MTLQSIRSLEGRRALPVFVALVAIGLAACGGDPFNGSKSAVPGAPTIGTVSPGNASATVAFTAPSSDGGSAITSYTATCTFSTVSSTGTGTASPITVSNLTNGTTYSCYVTATNTIGTSAASGSVLVTPAAN